MQVAVFPDLFVRPRSRHLGADEPRAHLVGTLSRARAHLQRRTEPGQALILGTLLMMTIIDVHAQCANGGFQHFLPLCRRFIH